MHTGATRLSSILPFCWLKVSPRRVLASPFAKRLLTGESVNLVLQISLYCTVFIVIVRMHGGTFEFIDNWVVECIFLFAYPDGAAEVDKRVRRVL